MTIICEDVQTKELKRLAIMVVLQAVEDARRKRRAEERLEAVLFLTSPDAAWWYEWAGLSFADIWAQLTAGTLRTARAGRYNGR